MWIPEAKWETISMLERKQSFFRCIKQTVLYIYFISGSAIRVSQFKCLRVVDKDKRIPEWEIYRGTVQTLDCQIILRNHKQFAQNFTSKPKLLVLDLKIHN